MAELTNIPDLNCSLHISNSTRTKPDAYFPNHGVNASHTIMECHKKTSLIGIEIGRHQGQYGLIKRTKHS